MGKNLWTQGTVLGILLQNPTDKVHVYPPIYLSSNSTIDINVTDSQVTDFHTTWNKQHTIQATLFWYFLTVS
jgi:hypothetical protein